ncbi:hypothetical protein R1flu_019394 [Riccia fluitans]|uniref:Uncharacterized protein n=1 Tax=Riccia fluitans TaxID=41844 RepID=A0ABD1ZK35_9MARC
MIRRVSGLAVSAHSASTTPKLVHSSSTALFSVLSATWKVKSALSSSNARSPVQLDHESAAIVIHSYHNVEALHSDRRRNVYTRVAASDEPTVATDGRAELEEFEFNPFRDTRKGFNQELLRVQTDELKQEILSGDFVVKPTPFTPVEGTQALQFYVICAFLFVAFWVGNYLAPDLIFKNTVFRSRSEEDDNQKAGAVQNGEQVDNHREQNLDSVQSLDSSTAGIRAVEDRTGKVGVGFAFFILSSGAKQSSSSGMHKKDDVLYCGRNSLVSLVAGELQVMAMASIEAETSHHCCSIVCVFRLLSSPRSLSVFFSSEPTERNKSNREL